MLRASVRPLLLALLAGPAVWAAGAGCATRERITFPPEVPTAPTSRITVPSADVTLNAGVDLQFVAVTEAPLGIDTIYAEISGTGVSFPPLVGAPSPATVGYTIQTAGLAGRTVVLRVFATDSTGQRGDTAVRQVTFQ
jgi:hypothetical protein